MLPVRYISPVQVRPTGCRRHSLRVAYFISDGDVASTGGTPFRYVCIKVGRLGSWGDGRLLILGTEGYIELRKYIDIATTNGPEQLLLIDGKGEHRIHCSGNVGFPFFGELILDCLHRTEKAMTQRHTFLAAELCLKAQKAALRL